MSQLLPARMRNVPILISASLLFAVPLASCGSVGDEGSRGSGDEGVTSYSANANPKDGDIVEEVASERADQNPVGTLHSGESGSSEENSGGEAGLSEDAGANPVASLPRRSTDAPLLFDCPMDRGRGCAYYFLDADGDEIGAGEAEMYALDTEPPGWVTSYPDNCPDVFNPEADQYGTGQPDSDGDEAGDACDPDPSGQYGDGTGQ